MKPFSNYRVRRNTAFVALLVWVFALASGVANACLLETQGKYAHVSTGQPSSGHHAHADNAVTGEAVAVDHKGDPDAAMETCLKVCDDGSNAPVKLQSGVGLADPGLAPLVVFAWSAATSVDPSSGRFDDLPAPGVGPPPRLRYSRLTL